MGLALEATYLSRRLTETRRAESLAASIQFDLARSGLDDDQLEEVVNTFVETHTDTGWGVSEVLNDMLSREPTRVAAADLGVLQNSLVARGYAAPDALADGQWSPTWAGALRRFDRDAYELQRSGKSWSAGTLESGLNMVAQTLPSNIWRNVVGWAKGFVEQTPETVERLGLAGGALAGAAIGTAIAPGAGTAIGAVAGGAIGFFADLFGDDPDEVYQGDWANLVDAVSPWTEYRTDPRALWEDVGWVASAAAVVGGAKLAASGAGAAFGAMQGSRAAAASRAGDLAYGEAASVALATGGIVPAAATTAGVSPSLTSALLTASGGRAQLGLVGSLIRGSVAKMPGSPGWAANLVKTIETISPTAMATKLPLLQIGNKLYTGGATASVGIKATAGMGQNARDLNAALRAQASATAQLAADEGRPLTPGEQELVDKAARGVGVSTIEQAIVNQGVPTFGGAIDLIPFWDAPLGLDTVGNPMDLLSFALWPDRFLPFAKGTIGNSMRVVNANQRDAMGIVEFLRRGSDMTRKEGVAFAQEEMGNVWATYYKFDAGVKELVSERLAGRTGTSAESALLDFNRTKREILSEIQSQGPNGPTVSRVMALIEGRHELVTAHLIETTAPNRSGVEAFRGHKSAQELVAIGERDIADQIFLDVGTGVLVKADRSFAVDVPIPGGGVIQKAGTEAIPFGRVREGGISSTDKATLIRETGLLEREISDLRRKANVVGGVEGGKLLARAKQTEEHLEIVQKALSGDSGQIRLRSTGEYKVMPARLDYVTKKDFFRLRREFLELRASVIDTAKKEMGGEENLRASAALEAWVEARLAEGNITEKLGLTTKGAKPTKSIANFLERMAADAADEIRLPDARVQADLESLGYKAVLTGDKVIRPTEIEKYIEATGVGDYSRRTAFFDTIGLRPDNVLNEDIWKLRRAAEKSEIQQVLDVHGVPARATDVQQHLYRKLYEMNHEGVTKGPFVVTPTGWRLYMADVRSLSMHDVLKGLDDFPGMTEEVVGDVYGALRRGAALGGEARLLHPVTSAHSLGRVLRVNGLAGFSDWIRTSHVKDPFKFTQPKIRKDWVYRPPARFVTSEARKVVTERVKALRLDGHISVRDEALNMMLLDSMADGAVRSGSYESLDDFFTTVRDTQLKGKAIEGEASSALDSFGSDFGDVVRNIGNGDYAALARGGRLKTILPDEVIKGLREQFDVKGRWSAEKAEAFGKAMDGYIAGKFKPKGSSVKAFEFAKQTIGALWARNRGLAVTSGEFSPALRRQLDERFAYALNLRPGGIGAKTGKALVSSQVLGGAAVGAVAGGWEGRGDGVFDSDMAQGAALGAAGGLGLRLAEGKTYGYLPDALSRMNSALRFTLSMTFDAGRYMEQNTIAMAKYGLPAMWSPKRYFTNGREFKTPYSVGKVSGDEAWSHVVRFWDDLNGTGYFHVIDDVDRRMYQAGMLGFKPRDWEAAQAFQLYQRGWNTAQINEAVSEIGRYGLGRSAAEKSANFVFFPFSFSKKYLSTLGDFILGAPGRNLLVTEGMRRYHESSLDEGWSDFVAKHAPILEQLYRINNLAFGISPGRFFLEGLTDDRTVTSQIAHTLAAAFVPGGLATPFSLAVGSATDLGINAFVPVVLTGESIDRLGGANNLYDVITRYVPLTREIQNYWSSGGEQVTALVEGGAPWHQFDEYTEQIREAKSAYAPLATAMGYSTTDGFLSSTMGQFPKAEIDALETKLRAELPSGFKLSTEFTNQSAVAESQMTELATQEVRSDAESAILALREQSASFDVLRSIGLDPALINAIESKTIREAAMAWVGDRRFNELYELFFAREHGPIQINV